VSLALAIDDLVAGYGATVVLDGVSLSMPAGGTLAVLGRNGVGKTTLLATLMGFTNRHRGTIRFGDRAIETMASHRRNRAGFGYVPQEREIFTSLSVEENLLIAMRAGGWTIDAVYGLFPALKERRHNSGNRLSGGEQQMLAVGRALVGAPKLLLLDEPTEGLAPIVVDALSDTLARIRDESSLSIVLVEQRVDLALSFARDAIVLDRGRIVWRGTSADLQADEATKHRLLGVAG
jgi:branched-chain amino acid transport system ATP-binding protein